MSFDTDFHTLRAFVALAETLHFTKAAERVGRSQSALSVQIRRLEDTLGHSLFLRNQRNVRLTESGEVFLGYARRLIDLQREAWSRLSEPEVEGEIRLGTPEDFATHYLPGVLATFRSLHPRVHLNVNCDLTLNLMSTYEKGLYDIVLLKRDPQSVTGGVRVWREPLVWVAGGEAPHSGPLPLVLSPSPCIYRARALLALNQQGRNWRIAYTSPSLTGTLAAVRSGLGIGVLPANMIPADVRIVDRAFDLPSLPDAEIALLAQPELGEVGQMLARHIMDCLDHGTPSSGRHSGPGR